MKTRNFDFHLWLVGLFLALLLTWQFDSSNCRGR